MVWNPFILIYIFFICESLYQRIMIRMWQNLLFKKVLKLNINIIFKWQTKNSILKTPMIWLYPLIGCPDKNLVTRFLMIWLEFRAMAKEISSFLIIRSMDSKNNSLKYLSPNKKKWSSKNLAIIEKTSVGISLKRSSDNI